MKFDQLSQIYQVVTPKSLTGGYEISGKKTTSNLYSLVMDLLINHDSSGVYGIKDLIDKLNELLKANKNDGDSGAKTISDYIKIFSDEGKVSDADYLPAGYVIGDSINSLQDFSKCKLSVLMSNTPNISQNLRDMNKVILFLTSIPTLELSRAQPYVDVRFQYNRPPLGGNDKRVQSPSLVRFLEGAVPSKNLGDAGNKMVTATTIDNTFNPNRPQDSQKSVNAVNVSESDMSLFLSPQTLMSSNNTAGEFRATNIIDPFRPLMSLESVAINVVASPSYTVAFKSMKLELVLHDRSRLSEIADLIRPAVYTGTSLTVEYGWRHPDQVGENPYSELINSMRVKEKYAIKNASYSFDQTGQVKINLDIHMMGANDIQLSHISETEEYRKTYKEIDSIKEFISDAMEQLGFKSDKDPRAYQILDAASRGEKAQIDDFKKELQKLRTNLNKKTVNTTLAKELSEKLNTLIGDDKNKKRLGLIDTLKGTVGEQIQKKFEGLKTQKDSFYAKIPATSAEYKNVQSIIDSKNKELEAGVKHQTVCSLSKLFLYFVGQPLQSMGKFDEIQFVYYPFNSSAGLVANTNIGQFPIEIPVLKQIMETYMKEKNVPDLTVSEFAKLVNDAVINDPRSLAYGLTDLYQKKDRDKPPQETNPNKKEVETRIDNILKARGANLWKQPVIEMYIEALPKRLVNKSNLVDADKTILRIHVYDKQSTPYEGMMSLRNAQSRMQASLDANKKLDENVGPAVKDALDRVSLANELSDVGIEFTAEPGQPIRLVGNVNPQKLKEFVSKAVPTLTYGTNATGMINANLQSIQIPELNSVNQLRTGAGTSTQPNGSGLGGLPLRVIPSQIDVNFIGCPLLTLNQQFFIDFGTGTSIDNFYLLKGLSHHIGPGKFESTAQFITLDAYGTYENIVSKLEQINKALEKSSK